MFRKFQLEIVNQWNAVELSALIHHLEPIISFQLQKSACSLIQYRITNLPGNVSHFRSHRTTVWRVFKTVWRVWRARDEGLLCLGLTWWFERSGLRYRSVIKCSTLIVDTKARYRVHKCVINCCIIELNWSVHEQKWWTNCVIPFRSHLFNFHSLLTTSAPWQK